MFQNKQPWRIAVFLLSVCAIAGMRLVKALYSAAPSLPREQWLPMLATGAAVTSVKAAGIFAVLILARWLAARLGKK